MARDDLFKFSLFYFGTAVVGGLVNLLRDFKLPEGSTAEI
jgi:hypothetical protein